MFLQAVIITMFLTVSIYNVPGTILKAKNFTYINSFVPVYELSNSTFCHLRDENTEGQSGCHWPEKLRGFNHGTPSPEPALWTRFRMTGAESPNQWPSPRVWHWARSAGILTATTGEQEVLLAPSAQRPGILLIVPNKEWSGQTVVARLQTLT